MMATKDPLLMSELHGQAMRSADRLRDLRESIAELQEIFVGRNALLAQVVGTFGGAWAASPATRHPNTLIGMGMLACAGNPLDFDVLERYVVIGYNRALMGGHSTADFVR